MGEGGKTLTDLAIDAGEKDIPKILVKMAITLEGINQQFGGIATRLKQGDDRMNAIQISIKELPCKLTSPTCPSPRPPWGKAKVAAAGSVIATVVLVVVETVKRLMS